MNNFTSLELSKKLKEGGCELLSKKVYSKWYYGILNIEKGEELFKGDYRIIEVPPHKEPEIEYSAYDFLNDICVKYCREFFGKYFEYPTLEIFTLLQQNKIQEAEDYIWEHCLFNKKKN